MSLKVCTAQGNAQGFIYINLLTVKKKKNQFSLPDIQRSFQMLKEWGTCDYGVGGVEVFY